MNPKEALNKGHVILLEQERRLVNKMYGSDIRNCPELRGMPDEKFPKHVFIIPDGNRRLAKILGISVEDGHKLGADRVVEDLRLFASLPIDTVTVWGFSSDNWKRDNQEIKNLMEIFEKKVGEISQELNERNGRFIHLGRTDRLDISLVTALKRAEIRTRNNTGQKVVLALDFGGEDQRLREEKNFQKHPLSPGVEVTMDQIWERRDAQGQIKSADLIIRTGEDGKLPHLSDVGWIHGRNTRVKTLSTLFPLVHARQFAQAIRDYSSAPKRLGA